MNDEGLTSCKSRGKSAPLPAINALSKAIKRSINLFIKWGLLYLGKNEKTLTCTYNSE